MRSKENKDQRGSNHKIGHDNLCVHHDNLQKKIYSTRLKNTCLSSFQDHLRTKFLGEKREKYRSTKEEHEEREREYKANI